MASHGRITAVRRILARQTGDGARRRPPARLRGGNGTLAAALQQLRTGVPLNWTQVEDDPQLITLASLQSRAQECRGLYTGGAPAELRAALYGRLTERLPQPRPAPVKQPAKPLAGFSESVPVLTQAEEDVPALTSAGVWPKLLMGALMIVLTFWAIGSFAHKPAAKGSFQWIEVRDGANVVAQRNPPPGWKPLQCEGFVQTSPPEEREFVSIPDLNQAQQYITYTIKVLPPRLTTTATYTLQLSGIAIAPCAAAIPDPEDSGAIVKMTYTVALHREQAAAISSLVVYQGSKLPVSVDVSKGAWKEVTFGQAHGIFWHGGPYRDIEGGGWIGDVSVMTLERGDDVLTFMGQSSSGITEAMLSDLAAQIDRDMAAAAGRGLPQFTWIELSRGDKVYAPRTLPAGWQPQECIATPDLNTQRGFRFTSVRTLDIASSFVGYPMLTLPITGTDQISYRVRSVQPGVRACGTRQLREKDPGAAAKLLYTLNDGPDGQGIQYSLSVFEERQKPTGFDLGVGNWEEVRAGDAHGIFWTGTQYRDPEGTFWPTNVNVVVFEKNDMIVTMLINGDRGIGKEQMLALASALK